MCANPKHTARHLPTHPFIRQSGRQARTKVDARVPEDLQVEKLHDVRQGPEEVAGGAPVHDGRVPGVGAQAVHLKKKKEKKPREGGGKGRKRGWVG